MRAITVKQPWPYAIFHLGKDVENRTQNINLPFPMDLAIHVSKAPDDDPDLPRGFAHLRNLREANDPEHRGKIVGIVTLVAIERSHSSRWYRGGKYAYVLENPRLLAEPLNARGYQSHWEVPRPTQRKFRFL